MPLWHQVGMAIYAPVVDTEMLHFLIGGRVFHFRVSMLRLVPSIWTILRLLLLSLSVG